MTTASTKAFIGKGSIYIEKRGGTTGLLPIGNCPDFSLSFGEDKKEMKDSEGVGGGVVASLSRISNVTGTVNSFSFSKENLAMALRAILKTEGVDPVVDEAHTANANAFISLVSIPEMATITVKDEAGTTTYVEGVDYALKSSGFIIMADGNILDGEILHVSYTPKGAVSIEMLMASNDEYRLVFDGLNEAASGDPVEITCHRIKFSPTQGLGLISDDFASLALTFDLLKDESITGMDLSPYARIRML